MKSNAVVCPMLSELGCVALLLALCASPVYSQAGTPALRYPPAPRGAYADDVNGIHVADPYRWLENTASVDTRAWVAAQTAVTQSFLATLPQRREVQNRVAQAWDYPKFGTPFAAGERLFFYENSGMENQPALYVQDRANSPPRVLIDVNALSRDGLFAIVDQAPSPDGRYLAYAATAQGSGWRTVRVREVRTGQDQSEEIHGVRRGPLSWTADERGFFYTRSDSTSGDPVAVRAVASMRERIFYHRLGRPQSEDQVVYDDPRQIGWTLTAQVSSDGDYLVIAARPGSGMQGRMYFIDLDNPRRPNLAAPIVKLFDGGDGEYDFVGNYGPVFFIRTTQGAPRGRLVAVDINAPDQSHWTTIVRETYDPLIAVRRVDDRFVAHRLHDVHSILELYTLTGAPRGTVPLPGNGTVLGMNGRPTYRELYVQYATFLQPPAVYKYDLETKTTVAYKETPPDTALVRYETTQLYFTSSDGTRVPMFLTARRGITLDGTHATLLSGTGSFGLAATPTFTPGVAAWLELGGVYAVANVRGGGEYGRAWHEAAMGIQKQVAADDFIGAAEFLVSQRYTRPSMLAAGGRGAGALLAGVAITQHPELFGAAILDAPLLDMARYDRFSNGERWTAEFGSPAKASDLRAILGYSPLHGLRAGTRYPATMITVGDHDDVVTPIHAYKFAAALQAAQGTGPPVLLRVEPDAGLASDEPVAKQMALDADRLLFLVNALRLVR